MDKEKKRKPSVRLADQPDGLAMVTRAAVRWVVVKTYKKKAEVAVEKAQTDLVDAQERLRKAEKLELVARATRGSLISAGSCAG